MKELNEMKLREINGVLLELMIFICNVLVGAVFRK